MNQVMREMVHFRTECAGPNSDNADVFRLRPVRPDAALIDVGSSSYVFHPPTGKLVHVDSSFRDRVLLRTGQATAGGDKDASDRFPAMELLQAESAEAMEQAVARYHAELPSLKCMMLNVAHTCNLSCDYCYASRGEYRGRSRRALMEIETAEQAVQFFLRDPSNPGEQEAIDFFGGEPLMNVPVLERVCVLAERMTAGRGRPLSFNLTTNGYLLTRDVFDLLRAHDVRILVSIDGDRKTHDAHRKTRNGAGSYARIVQNLHECLSVRPDLISARATITPNAVDVCAIDDHLHELGLTHYGFEMMYDGFSPDAGRWDREQARAYDRSYGRYAARLLGLILAGERVQRNLGAVLSRLLRIEKRERTIFPCRMSREVFAVSPDGDFYPCHWLSEREQYRVGSIHTGPDVRRRKELYPRAVQEKRRCGSCWARYLCGGGCPAISLLRRGDDGAPDPWVCWDRRVTWKWMIWLYIRLAQRGMPLRAVLKADPRGNAGG